MDRSGSGRAPTGRGFVSVSMDYASMPPPLSTISTGTGGAGTIAASSASSTQMQQTVAAAAALRSKVTNNDQLTVVAVRNTAPPMINLSATTPRLVSFSSGPNVGNPSSLQQQREVSVIMNRSAPTVNQITTGRQSSVQQPVIKMAKTETQGRTELAIAHDDSQQQQQQQNTGRINSIQSQQLGAAGFTLQFGSTNIMSSQQTAKIGHTTIVKQSLKSAPAPHVIPVGQACLPIAGATKASILQQQQQHTPVGGVASSSSTPSAAVKLCRPIVQKQSMIQQSAIVSAPALAGLSPSSIQETGGGGGIVTSVNVSAVGPSLIVQPTTTAISSAALTLQHSKQLQPSSFAPLKPGLVHQHVLPYGTTIKVTPSGVEQQQQQAPVANVSATGGQLEVGPPRATINTPVVPASQPQQQPQLVPAANPIAKVVLNTKNLLPCAVPPLYVPSVTNNVVRGAVSLVDGVITSHTPIVTTARVVDESGEKLISRVIKTATSGGQTPRLIVAPSAATGGGQQQLKQQPPPRSTPKAFQALPKLAPFSTQATVPSTLQAPRSVVLSVVKETAAGNSKMQEKEEQPVELATAAVPSKLMQNFTMQLATSSSSSSSSSSCNTRPFVVIKATESTVEPSEVSATDEQTREANEESKEEAEEERVEILEDPAAAAQEDGNPEQTMDEVAVATAPQAEDNSGDEGVAEQNAVIEILDSSIDSSVRKTILVPVMQPKQQPEQTPKKAPSESQANKKDAKHSRVSPRLKKRSLSEQQKQKPAVVQLILEPGMVLQDAANTTTTKPAVPERPESVARKRSDSVHVVEFSSTNDDSSGPCVQLILDKISTFKSLLNIPPAQHHSTDDASPHLLKPALAAGVDEEKKKTRLPLKDATNNEAAEEGVGDIKCPVPAKPEKKQDNILLLCNERFDMLPSAAEEMDCSSIEQQQQPSVVRRTSRRILHSSRREHEMMSDCTAMAVKLAMVDDESARLGDEVPEIERDGDGGGGGVPLVHHGKSKRARKDENSGGLGFVNVRSNSTSSESNMASARKFDRRSLPEDGAGGGNVTTKSISSKAAGKKSSSVSAVQTAAGTRGRQAALRSSIAGGAASESSVSVTEDKDSKDGVREGSSALYTDLTTVSDHLRWYDGIGYLNASHLHFEFNDFGLVQPITTDQYMRHCATDVFERLTKPIGLREESAGWPKDRKRRKAAEPERLYRCAECRVKGDAADFVTPEYCSIECLKKHNQTTILKYLQQSTQAQQHQHQHQQGIKLGHPGEGPPPAKKKKDKRAAEKAAQKRVAVVPAAAAAAVAAAATTTTVSTPTTTITTNSTSDDDSRSSLSLNSNAFIEKHHLSSLNPTTPPSIDDPSLPATEGGGGTDAINNTTTTDEADGSEFSWEKYLLHVKAVPAPPELFLQNGRQPFPAAPNRFQVGMKLEAIDPENCSLFCVCTVAEVRGYRLKLHFDGYESDYDFWVNADSPDIFPPGWCRSTNRVLQPPSDYTDGSKVFRWKEYLLQTGATVPDHRWFLHINRTTRNDFEIGMALEADDLKKSGKVCVATVADKLLDRILVHFDGWDSRYDYWVSVHSPYIHPINWHAENNDKITPPPDWHKPFSWERYLRFKRQRGSNQNQPTLVAGKALFQTRSPIGFMPGQRLEVVDRKQQLRIRPATVVATDGYEVQVCFDGWPHIYAFWIEDDSPNIHPVNWCARTRHPLEPPPNYLTPIETCDGTCEMRFCMGRGNAKLPNKKYHDRAAECPYKRSNWMSEEHKKLRISHNQVQKHITDVFSGGLYDPVNRRTSNIVAQSKVKSSASTAPPSRPGSPHHGRAQQSQSKAGVVEPAAGAIPLAQTASGVIMPPSKRIKQEVVVENPGSSAGTVEQHASSSSSSSTRRRSRGSFSGTLQDSPKEGDTGRRSARNHPASSSSAMENANHDHNHHPESSTSTKTTDRDSNSLRIALPVIKEYGPRLLHAYELWRENSRILDEATGDSSEQQSMKNPLNWTTDETAQYIEKLPGCDECASKIRLEEITGRSLLSFTQDDLVKYMGIKIGPAIKIYNRIIHLRQIVTTKFIQL